MKWSLPFLVLTLFCALLFSSIVSAQFSDADGDGIDDTGDNCPFAHNVHQQDQDADSIGDAYDERTLYGRFASYLAGSDDDRQLRKSDGSPILPEEVPGLYGTADGMSIYSFD